MGTLYARAIRTYRFARRPIRCVYNIDICLVLKQKTKIIVDSNGII